MANYKFGKKSLERAEGVHPDIMKVAKLALRISSKKKRNSLDFTIPKRGGVRLAEVQNKLYLDKKSKADGYIKLSRHQIKEGDEYGTALDIIAYVGAGGGTYNETLLTHVATCMLEASIQLCIPIEWGGNWKTFYDPAHYQLVL